MLPAPYFADEMVTLYHADCRDLLPHLAQVPDCVIADPPYGETTLPWDRWPGGWPAAVAATGTRSMWCFGSMRMFLAQAGEFGAWRMSQDVVWEKHNGSGLAADRFRRVHEHAVHWYRGSWTTVYRQVPTTQDAAARTMRRRASPTHTGAAGPSRYTTEEGGDRLMRSVIYCRSKHGRARHPTEKPVGILIPLITYACPPGGAVLDPFAGSGATAEAARLTGRRAVLIEDDERFCDVIAARLGQGVLLT